MGNKPVAQNQSEEEEERLPPLMGPRGMLDQNGEEAEDEVELPPPMKPINEPLVVAGSEDNQGKRVSRTRQIILQLMKFLKNF